jgi:AcrR family transcriptional regulator
MPKTVDHDERRDEIVRAAIEILAEGGPRMLTVRALARKLGGSLRLVNYYFPTRHALLEGLQHQLDEAWQSELDRLDASSADARTRLRSFLIWALSLDEQARTEERAWLSLLSVPPQDQASVATLHAHGARWMRAHLSARLEGLVARKRLEETTDLLHAAVRGIIVTSEENPEAWPPDYQVAVLDGFLRPLELLPDQPLEEHVVTQGLTRAQDAP